MNKLIITITITLFYISTASFAASLGNYPDVPMKDDTTPPTITCPDNFIAATDSGQCSATVETLDPVYTDDVGVTTLTWVLTGATPGNSPSEGINVVGTHVFNPGVTTVTYTASDAAGNSASCSYTVTIYDDQAPLMACPLGIVAGTDQDSCWAYVDPGFPIMVSDNCALDSVWNDYTGTPSAIAWYPMGVTTIIWHATDHSANETTCTQNVTVIDDIQPTIVCPSNIVQTTDPASCGAYVSIPSPLTWDNCYIDTVYNSYTQTGDASGYYAVGTIAVTWWIYDIAGNVNSCYMTVGVADAEPPEIYCPPDITVDSLDQIPEPFSFYEEFIAAGGFADDNCITDFGSFILLSEIIEPDTVYKKIRTYGISDLFGNSSSCEQKIYVLKENLGLAENNQPNLKLMISPNPSTAITFVKYALQEPSEVILSVVDLFGNERQTLHIGRQGLGGHRITLDVSQMPAGVYYLRLKAGNLATTGKMVVVR